MTTNTIPQCESRIDSSELRLMAERADVNGMPQYAQALRQAADDAEDVERWREFIHCGWPVCFLGETYDNAADINAAVDTARKEPK